jgi:methionine synthase II (cobalamin-independent)
LLAQACSPFDIGGPAFVSWRAWLRGLTTRPGVEHVKVQLAGPATVGVALLRDGGLPSDARRRAGELVADAITAMMKSLREHGVRDDRALVFIDEPALVLWERGNPPWSRAQLVDDIGASVAHIGANGATSGVHVCGDGDAAAAIDARCAVLNVTVGNARRFPTALTQHCRQGGLVAWGAVPTDGTARLADLSLDRLWAALQEALETTGDPALTASRSLVTPECGLAGHTTAAARHALRLAADLALLVSTPPSR